MSASVVVNIDADCDVLFNVICIDCYVFVFCSAFKVRRELATMPSMFVASWTSRAGVRCCMFFVTKASRRSEPLTIRCKQMSFLLYFIFCFGLVSPGSVMIPSAAEKVAEHPQSHD